MLYQDLPWGIKTLDIHGIIIYSIRLKFKDDMGLKIASNYPRFTVKKENGHIYVTCSTTDPVIGTMMQQFAGNLCKKVAKQRLDRKYGWVKI